MLGQITNNSHLGQQSGPECLPVALKTIVKLTADYGIHDHEDLRK